jgi:hypothetical protein
MLHYEDEPAEPDTPHQSPWQKGPTTPQSFGRLPFTPEPDLGHELTHLKPGLGSPPRKR